MSLSTAKNPLVHRLALVAACAAGALALLAAPAAAAPAKPGATASQERANAKGSQQRGEGNRSRAHRRQAQRRRRARARRIRRANRGVGLSNNDAVSRPRAPQADTSSSDLVLDAGFENGLYNWNTAGVGEVIPAVANDAVRNGSWSGRFMLSGSQHRSELILGGNGGGSVNNAIRFYEGDEYWYSFSFYIQSMTYGKPGAHNLIMQFKGDDEGSPYFGLQLWDYEGDDGESGGRGLWSHGEGMDGDRFLSPVAERRWHDVVVHLRTSSRGAGLYEVYLNGNLIDAADGVSLIPSDADHAYIKSGLYRNGDEIPGTSEIRLDAVRLGRSMSAVLPG